MELYISSITNLTDARFFGAYGIQYFGFCFDVLDPNAITIDKAKEITSWLHEPKIIGQFGEHQSPEEMMHVHKQLPLYAVLVSAVHPQKDQIELPLWTVTHSAVTDKKTSGIFVSADWARELLQEVLSQNPYGIHIACSKEENPGISRIEYYMELMEIIEPHLT